MFFRVLTGERYDVHYPRAKRPNVHILVLRIGLDAPVRVVNGKKLHSVEGFLRSGTLGVFRIAALHREEVDDEYGFHEVQRGANRRPEASEACCRASGLSAGLCMHHDMACGGFTHHIEAMYFVECSSHIIDFEDLQSDVLGLLAS